MVAMAVAHHVSTVVMVAHHVAVPMAMTHHPAMTSVAVHAVHPDVDDVGRGIDGTDHAGSGGGGGSDADGAECGQGGDGEQGLPHRSFLAGCWWPGSRLGWIRQHRETAMLRSPFRGVRTSKPGMDKGTFFL